MLSFSGGKDSTFLLLELIRRKEPLDEVVFFDTGWEFPAMYEHIEKVKSFVKNNGIKFVTLRSPVPFDEAFKVYGWCGGNIRWGTYFKTETLDKYAKSHNALQYIGIAFDEKHRQLNKEKLYPLVDWKITEKDCLIGCYKAGFDFGGLYTICDRVSCAYCRNKSISEIKKLREAYPDYWEKLKSLQSQTNIPYKQYFEIK